MSGDDVLRIFIVIKQIMRDYCEVKVAQEGVVIPKYMFSFSQVKFRTRGIEICFVVNGN